MSRQKIPTISDERLEELAERITPLVRFNVRDVLRDPTPTDVSHTSDGLLFRIEAPRDLRSVSYIWEPKAIGKPMIDVHCFDIIRTYHSCGHPSFFKPSVAEVLAQLTPDRAKRAVAFEIVNGDIDVRNCLGDGEYHAALTRLYDDGEWAYEVG